MNGNVLYDEDGGVGIGVTVPLVEQHVEQALEVADRAFVLADGRTVGSGTGAEMLANDDVRKAYLSV